MRASRGMGDINPSKMPKAKTVVRKDNPNDVTVYKKGGKVWDKPNPVKTHTKLTPAKKSKAKAMAKAEADRISGLPVLKDYGDGFRTTVSQEERNLCAEQAKKWDKIIKDLRLKIIEQQSNVC